MFAAVLHWYPSREDYEALTIVELEELREVCKELQKTRK